MSQPFDISSHRHDGVHLVSVSGEIDLATAPSLRDELGNEGADKSATTVVDLTEVTFLDSTALGVLVGARKARAEAGGQLRLVVAAPRILKIFEITGLDEVFTIRPTVAKALEA